MCEGHWFKSRRIVERILIQADLILETPACFGGGESKSLSDIALALDPLEGRALLTGTSIAGALRSYLREREFGYFQDGGPDALHNLLFGRQKNDEGEQSWLITYDALGDDPSVEMRDGVAIDPKTHTAKEKEKFDIELLEAGTRFPIRVELLVPADENSERLLQGLAIALEGFERGEIRLGARKRRGFGQCRVAQWNVIRYDLRTPDGLLSWLKGSGTPQTGSHIADLLGVQTNIDRRIQFVLKATFSIEGSLLIRSGGESATEPDMVHLHSRRNGTLVPILSGTSLAGALRARALRIAKTIGEEEKAHNLVNLLFGPDLDSTKKPRASRLLTSETEISSSLSLVQTRVKIDRFTGGSYPGALFNEQPVWGTPETTISVEIIIQQPTQAQIGLVLLLLKDLWTGDLPLGGEISVGRGRLKGQEATLTYRDPEGSTEWNIRQNGTGLVIEGDRDMLESFVTTFVEEVKP